MTLLLSLLAACSAPDPTGPSPEASAEGAASLCKIFEGAGQDCERSGATVTAADHTVHLNAIVVDEQSALGITSVVLQVETTVDGQPRPELVTPAAASGGESRSDLLDRAFHEWALVHGTAIVDMLLNQEGRPALAAVDPSAREDTTGRTVAGREVFRGWTLLQGSSERSIDHEKVLGQLAPALGDIEPGWHAVNLRIDHEPGNAQYRCSLDGADAPALCEAARHYAWPVGGPLTRIRQYYVLAPSAPKESPGPAPAEGAGAGGEGGGPEGAAAPEPGSP